MTRIATLMLAILLLSAPILGASDVGEASAEVERIRGLRFTEKVEVVVVPRADLDKVLREQLASGSSISLDDQMRVLEALLLIERSESAVDELLEVYEAQVLAFYDPSTRKYYTFDSGPDSQALPELMADGVAIHELTHALQDQRFEAGATLRGLEKNWDAQIAYHAVLEGEATLVMLAALMGRLDISLEQIAANEDLLASISSMAAMNPGFPEEAQRYFVELLKFPYIRGLALVLEAYRREGWSGVDRLHQAPPRSSAEVLRPELYFARTARRGRPCSGDGLIATSLGEFHWSLLVGDEAARGWESDCVQAVEAEGRISISGTSNWDTPSDAKEFASALEALIDGNGRRGEVAIEQRNVRFSWAGASGSPKPPAISMTSPSLVE